MNKFTDETPIAMLTVGQLKEILGIDRILGNLTAHQTPTEQVMTCLLYTSPAKIKWLFSDLWT